MKLYHIQMPGKDRWKMNVPTAIRLTGVWRRLHQITRRGILFAQRRSVEFREVSRIKMWGHKCYRRLQTHGSRQDSCYAVQWWLKICHVLTKTSQGTTIKKVDDLLYQTNMQVREFGVFLSGNNSSNKLRLVHENICVIIFLLANLKIFQANLYCLGLTINGMRKELIFVNNYGQKIPVFTGTAGKKKITIHDQNFCNMGSERSNVAIYMVFWEDSIFVDVFIADLLNCNRVSCSKIRENNFETMATSTYMTLKNSLYSRLTKELTMT